MHRLQVLRTYRLVRRQAPAERHLVPPASTRQWRHHSSRRSSVTCYVCWTSRPPNSRISRACSTRFPNDLQRHLICKTDRISVNQQVCLLCYYWRESLQRRFSRTFVCFENFGHFQHIFVMIVCATWLVVAELNLSAFHLR